MGGDHAGAVVVGAVHDSTDLLVDHLGGVVGVVLLGKHHLPLVASGVVDESDTLAHAPFEDHGAGVLRGHLDVHARTARGVAGLLLLGDPTAAEHAKRGFDVLPAVAVTVLLGEAERRAAGGTTWNDGDLVERVGVFELGLDDRVAGLVIGGGDPVLLLDLVASTGAAPTDLVPGFLEIGHLDEVLVGHRRDDRGFVDHGREIGATEHRGSTTESHEIDVRSRLHLAGVHGENLGPAFEIGERHADRPVEPAGAGQGRVEHVGPVGRGDDDDLVGRVEAVHLDENRVERLLAFVMSAGREPTASSTTDRVDLVEEDDARGVLLGLLEEVSHSTRTHADEHLDEVGTGDREERHVGLARDRLGEQRLAAAGESFEQHAPGNSSAESLESLGVLEEGDQFLDLLLGFLHPGHVLEGDVHGVLGLDPVAALAEVSEHAARATAGVPHGSQDEEPDDEEDQDDRSESDQQVHPRGIGGLLVEGDAEGLEFLEDVVETAGGDLHHDLRGSAVDRRVPGGPVLDGRDQFTFRDRDRAGLDVLVLDQRLELVERDLGRTVVRAGRDDPHQGDEGEENDPRHQSPSGAVGLWPTRAIGASGVWSLRVLAGITGHHEDLVVLNNRKDTLSSSHGFAGATLPDAKITNRRGSRRPDPRPTVLRPRIGRDRSFPEKVEKA